MCVTSINKFFLFTFILVFTCLACNNNSKELTAREVEGTFVESSLSDSLFFSAIRDIERADDTYYLINEKSDIFMLDADFTLVNHLNVNGPGPGEIGQSFSIYASKDQIVFLDITKLNFVFFDKTLEFVKELAANDLVVTPFFNFLIQDTTLITGFNNTENLLSRFPIKKNDGQFSKTGIGEDIVFPDFSGVNYQHNLYRIHEFENYLLLVNEKNPQILLTQVKENKLNVIKKYNYGDIAYLQPTLSKNKEFHENKSNPNSYKSIVIDSDIYQNKLFLLIGTHNEGRDYSRTLLEFKIDFPNFVPQAIYQLSIKGQENIEWINNFSTTKAGNIIAFDGSYSKLIKFNI